MKKLIIVVGAVFAFLLVLGINCYAEGKIIYGCQQKNDGQLRIVSNPGACRPSETSISWNAMGPEGPQGPAGPAGPQGSAGPEGAQGPAGPAAPQDLSSKGELGPSVYDANSQLLGILPSTADGFLSFLIPDLSKFIFISPVTGDIDPYYPGVYLYFDGNYCSGNSYLDLSMRYEIVKVDSKYIAAEEVPAKAVNIYSKSEPDWGSGKRPCKEVNLPSYPVLPCKEVPLPFTMPVALPLQIKY